MTGLHVWRCARCAFVAFPARLLCPRCGSNDWIDTPVVDGVIGETTEVSSSRSVRTFALASVTLADGVVAVARVEGLASPGDGVKLAVDDGALVARRVNRPMEG
jgi:uncharacterized OB-fold protein